jgi:hypothetical protein
MRPTRRATLNSQAVKPPNHTAIFTTPMQGTESGDDLTTGRGTPHQQFR